MITEMAESTSRRPERSRYEVPWLLTNWMASRIRRLASISFCFNSASTGSAYSFLSCSSVQVSKAPEETPRTAATTCNWLVPS